MSHSSFLWFSAGLERDMPFTQTQTPPCWFTGGTVLAEGAGDGWGRGGWGVWRVLWDPAKGPTGKRVPSVYLLQHLALNHQGKQRETRRGTQTFLYSPLCTKNLLELFCRFGVKLPHTFLCKYHCERRGFCIHSSFHYYGNSFQFITN